MDQCEIVQHVREAFPEVDIQVASKETGAPEIAWGDTFFFTPGGDRRFPFATIVTKDYGDFDKLSNLNRDGVFRLNIGVGKEKFRSMFGPPPKSGESAGGFDFTALDVVMPHPVYAQQYWVSVLNPSEKTFHDVVLPLLEAGVRAVHPR